MVAGATRPPAPPTGARGKCPRTAKAVSSRGATCSQPARSRCPLRLGQTRRRCKRAWASETRPSYTMSGQTVAVWAWVASPRRPRIKDLEGSRAQRHTCAKLGGAAVKRSCHSHSSSSSSSSIACAPAATTVSAALAAWYSFAPASLYRTPLAWVATASTPPTAKHQPPTINGQDVSPRITQPQHAQHSSSRDTPAPQCHSQLHQPQ